MPTIIILGPVKIKIYPHDHRPPHVHAIGPDCEAKFELDGFDCIFSRGFSGKDIKRLQEYLQKNQEILWEAWNEYQEK